MPACRGERGSGRGTGTPGCAAPSGPGCGGGARAARRSAPAPRRLESLPRAGLSAEAERGEEEARPGAAGGLRAAGRRRGGCVWSRCALRAESASRQPQPGDVKAECAAPAVRAPRGSCPRPSRPPGARSGGRAGGSAARAAGLPASPGPPATPLGLRGGWRRRCPRCRRSRFPEAGPATTLDLGHCRRAVASRRPGSSRIRSARLEGRSGHGAGERLRAFPVSVIFK